MFPNAVRLFDVLGFELRVDPSWIVIAALIVWSLATGYFPEAAPGLHRVDYLAFAAIGTIGLFAGLVLHELAHAVTAHQLGLGIGGITLFLFGGVAELDREPASPATELRIAAAGPAMSVALATLFGVFAETARSLDASLGLVALLDYLAGVNLILALFNLLPAFPLDGGRILRAALWRTSGDLLSATRHASRAGRAVGYALVALGLLLIFSTQTLLAGLWPILIGLFLAAAATATYRRMLAQEALRGQTVADLMTPATHTATPDLTVRALVDEVMLRHGVGFVPVIEGRALLGYVDSSAVRGIDRDNWDATRVEDVFVPFAPDMAARPDEPLDHLLRRIAETGRRKFLVTDDRGFAGVVTLADLAAHLAVLRDLDPPDRPRRPPQRI
jgi:Zn-dependent protease